MHAMNKPICNIQFFTLQFDITSQIGCLQKISYFIAHEACVFRTHSVTYKLIGLRQNITQKQVNSWALQFTLTNSWNVASDFSNALYNCKASLWREQNAP